MHTSDEGRRAPRRLRRAPAAPPRAKAARGARWVAAAALASAACAYDPFVPDVRTPTDRAREIDAHCIRSSGRLDADALSPAIVEGVDPAYSHVPSDGDRAVRLRGARLRIRPGEIPSAEALQRSLECHQARVTLGIARELEHDPFVFPGTWLDITATSSGDGFVVAVQVDDVAKARAVLARAQSFALSRR